MTTCASASVPFPRRRFKRNASGFPTPSRPRADIRQLRDHTTRDFGQETGAIFNFHLGLLDDPTLLDTFYRGVEKNRFTAEYAVSRSLREYSKQFLRQKDIYFRDRVKDIYDIERRLINKLQGANGCGWRTSPSRWP